MAEEKQTFCERCGEPCGNEPVCGSCLQTEAAEKAAVEESEEDED